MNVTVVPPVAETWTPSPDQRASAAALAACRATTFIRAQGAWLRKGLLQAWDQVTVDIVLAAHDRSHGRWLDIVTASHQALGSEAATRLSGLYGYCGRVAGALEAGAITLLEPTVAAQARDLAAERLDAVTEQAVEALWSAAAQA